MNQLVAAGETEQMPSVLGGKINSIPFSDLRTCNAVDPEMHALADNL